MAAPLNILLVEDDPLHASRAKQLLMSGWTAPKLHVIEDGESALSYLDEIITTRVQALPDLILLNLKLPRISGIEVLRRIKERPEMGEIPVVILGDEQSQDLELALRLGPKCILESPPNLENLNSVIQAMESAWLTVVGLPEDERPVRDGSLMAPADKKEQVLQVLLVEDDRRFAEALVLALRAQNREDFKIAKAQSLAAAIDHLRFSNFDAILLDLNLPDSRALDTLCRLMEHTRDVPVVILTGMTDEKLGIDALERGAQDFLVKGAIDGPLLRRSLLYAIQRKRAERLAQKSITLEGDVLREVLVTAPVGVARIASDMAIIDANSMFGREFCIQRSEAIGKPVCDLLPSLPRERLQRVIDHGVPFVDESVRTVSKLTDEVKYWDIIVWPLALRHERRRQAFCLFLDVTEKVTTERQRDDFVAAIVHDIKNPLVGEQRIVDSLMSGALELSPSQMDLMHVIKKSNQALLVMLGNLLEMYKFNTIGVQVAFHKMDFVKLSMDCLSEAAPLLKEAGLTLRVKIGESAPSVMADPSHLRRLIMNLLYNAIKFTRPGGYVEFNCEFEVEDVVFSVTDTGIGIPESEQADLFKRFWQGHSGRRQSTGSGLGLFIAGEIVKAHHGEINCLSKLNEGSTFTVRLPINQQHEAAAQEQPV